MPKHAGCARRTADLIAMVDELADAIQKEINQAMGGERWQDHPEYVARQRLVDRARRMVKRGLDAMESER